MRRLLFPVLMACFITIFPFMAKSADESMLIYLPFDDGAGDTARDVTGHGHDGTLVGGPEWTEGEFGGALRVDGDSNFVDLGAKDEFAINSDMTVMLWVNPAGAGGIAHVVCCGKNGNALATHHLAIPEVNMPTGNLQRFIR